MNELPYKKGTIKLTWINPNNNSILESSMYNSVDEALKNLPTNITNNNFLIFELTETDGKNYRWKLLPYGIHNIFLTGMKFKDNKFFFFGSILLSIFGTIFLYQLITKK